MQIRILSVMAQLIVGYTPSEWASHATYCKGLLIITSQIVKHQVDFAELVQFSIHINGMKNKSNFWHPIYVLHSLFFFFVILHCLRGQEIDTVYCHVGIDLRFFSTCASWREQFSHIHTHTSRKFSKYQWEIEN